MQINASAASLNVALASTGAVATASSFHSAPYAPAATNNGDRKGLNWGTAGGGWNDATANQFPDWLQIDFAGSQTIDRVVVYTLQDNYTNPVEPSDTLTFSQWGIRDFTVQGWNGTAWVTLGTVSANNLVKRTVSFPAFTTDRIRINVTNALGGYSRIVEVEAWGIAAPPATTTTALASSLNPSTVGAAVSFTGSWRCRGSRGRRAGGSQCRLMSRSGVMP